MRTIYRHTRAWLTGQPREVRRFSYFFFGMLVIAALTVGGTAAIGYYTASGNQLFGMGGKPQAPQTPQTTVDALYAAAACAAGGTCPVGNDSAAALQAVGTLTTTPLRVGDAEYTTPAEKATALTTPMPYPNPTIHQPAPEGTPDTIATYLLSLPGGVARCYAEMDGTGHVATVVCQVPTPTTSASATPGTPEGDDTGGDTNEHQTPGRAPRPTGAP